MKKKMSGFPAKLIAILIVIVMAVGLVPVAAFAGPDAEPAGVSQADLTDSDAAAPEPWGALPNSNQLQYQREELAAFCHFGMNTFTNSEWGTGNERPSQFNLQKDFDADNYVKTLKDAGFTKLIVTAKHHDGFCIWPSEFTDHDVASSPYKDGKGDILAEISAACTKYDMDMGLYLSPWDENAESYGYYDENGNPTTADKDVLDYNDYYANQIKEIASNPKYGNNGHFVEWWMDGAKGTGQDAQDYDFDRWFATIQKYEGKAAGYDADCMLFGAGAYTTVRWIGNESGFADNETWSKSRVNYETNSINSNSVGSYTRGFADGNQWTVPECDARITPGWFWHAGQSPKTMEQLSEMYFRSVGHNAPLLLNVPPNNQGTLDEAIRQRTLEFGESVRKLYSNNLAAAEGVKITASSVRGDSTKFGPANVVDGDADTYWTMDDGQTTGSITIDLGTRRTFDVVSIQEDIALGQRVSGYSVEYKDGDGEWKTLETGPTIGERRLVRTAPVRADKVRINITGSHAVPVISEIGIYKADENFEIGSAVPDGLDFIDNAAFSTTGNWSAGTAGLEGTNMWSNVTGNTASFSFTGSKFWIVGEMDPSHGIASVSVDGNEAGTFDLYRNQRANSQTVYESPDLKYGQHNVVVTVTGTKNAASSNRHIDLDGAYYLDNNGAGMFEIEQPKYSVVAGDTIDILVKRVGGSTGEATVLASDNPGGAVQGQYYQNTNETLTFKDGETEKVVSIPTYVNEAQTDDLNFYLELSKPGGGAELGFSVYSEIILKYYWNELAEALEKARPMQEAQYEEAGWGVFAAAREAAEAVDADKESTYEQVRAAAKELVAAMEALEKRGVYTENKPFVLPAEKGSSKLLEAEYFTLIERVPGAVPDSTNKNVRITNNTGASNGQEVNWFEDGNTIKLPYKADKAGVYTFKATYRSGRNASAPNVFSWSGDNIVSGYQDVYGPEASTFRTIDLDITIEKPGTGWLVFTATSKAGPVIDKFDVSLKEASEVTHTITAAAGTGGSIDPAGEVDVIEGASKQFTITPDEGYQVKDVLVDGESVGAVTEYTLNDVRKAMTIEAQFEFGYYTADNPFVLPKDGEEAKTLEAEHFKLYPRVPGEAPNGTNKNVRLSEKAGASNGLEVNWFEEGNVIKLPYYADKAGTYTFTATYRSGRVEGKSQPNAINWSGDKVTAGTIDVYGEDGAAKFHTAEFDVIVNEAGAGELVLTADAKAGPVLDKFDVVKVKTEPVVDKGDLEKLIGEIEGLKSDEYRSSAWAVMQDTKLPDAKAVFEDKAATQEEVNDAWVALFVAKNALLKERINKQSLRAYISMAEERVGMTDKFTASAINAVKAALEEAKSVEKFGDATQDAIDDASRKLYTAVMDMLWKADTSKLQMLVEAAREMSENLYTPDSWKPFDAALTKAEEILADGDLSENDEPAVESARTELFEAMRGLVDRADTSALKTAIGMATEILENADRYAPASIAGLQGALDGAKTVYNDANATQKAVDDAAAALNAKLTAVYPKSNKDQLRMSLRAARSVNLSLYTPETATPVRTAMTVAEKLEADENVKQAEVDKAQAMLDHAVKGLVAKETPTTPGTGETPGTTNPTNPAPPQQPDGTTPGGNTTGGTTPNTGGAAGGTTPTAGGTTGGTTANAPAPDEEDQVADAGAAAPENAAAPQVKAAEGGTEGLQQIEDNQTPLAGGQQDAGAMTTLYIIIGCAGGAALVLLGLYLREKRKNRAKS